MFENVKGLLSHEQGKTFQTILGVLSDLGYRVEWQVLNSKNFGVPQNRERVFIVGHLGKGSGQQIFPIGETNGAIDKRFDTKNTTSEIASTIRSRYGNGTGSHIKQLNQPKHSNDRVYSEEGLSPTLNTMQGGNRQPFVRAVLTPDRANKRQNGRRMKEDGEPSFTLTGQDKHGVYLNDILERKRDKLGRNMPIHRSKEVGIGRIRRLTPLECERLMAYPDKWTEEGTEGKISDTQRYKMCGNGIVSNVVAEVISKLNL